MTAAVRLAYVLRHFRQVYDAVPAISIGYADSQPTIEVADEGGPFFQQSRPYPPAPHWRTWEGQRVPFFFDSASAAPLLEMRANTVRIAADVISAAFYLLSGWQEYFADARDRHGRFPYAASVQQQYGFVALPVVNYYFDVLKTAIEQVTGRRLQPKPWRAGAGFAVFVSHDVDYLRSAWKSPTKAALRQGRLLEAAQRLWRRLARPDAWDNLEAVATAVAAYGARSTFFMLPEHRPGSEGTPNADYALSPGLRRRLQALESEGCEVGLHGSIGTATAAPRLAWERAALPHSPRGLRFHYLRWDPRRTPAVVDAGAGFAYDSTLGFAEHFGFRHSYCHPFYPFNFATGGAHAFLEIPLNVMDATLHHPHYLQLSPAEVLPALRPMFAEIEKFGGVATLLWHNDRFDPANTAMGPQQFSEVMGHLQQRGAAFLRGRDIWQHFSRA